MRGAAQKTPIVENPRGVVKKRNRRKYGASPKRMSRRVQGEEPSVLDVVPSNNALKKLSLGGQGGKIYKDKTEWNFDGVSKVQKQFTINNSKGENDETYRIMDLKEVENGVNSMAVCNCRINNEIDNFVEFCIENDGEIKHKMETLKREWKKKAESDFLLNDNSKKSNKINIKHDQLGVCTKAYLHCSNCNRKSTIQSKQANKFKGTCYNGKPTDRENCSWYVTNLTTVLGTIAAGIGPSDIQNFLAFLDIPIPSSFPYGTFCKIESLIGETLKKVANKSMDEGLLEEIEKQTGETYQEFIKSNKKVGIFGSYDMGWNKRSSGHRYDSMSGHAFLIGCLCKKIVAAQITSKKCNVCAKSVSKGKESPPHECPLNHEGSSKSMEADSALKIVRRIFYKNNKRVYVKGIVGDDDSLMKAIVKHKQNNKKGQLPDEIPEPIWLADPGYRTKTVSRKIYALVSLPKSQSTCCNGDAVRFKMNFGYMLKRNRRGTLKQMSKAAKAVIDHSFNYHEYCSEEWCLPKLEEKQKKNLPSCPDSKSNGSLGLPHPYPPSDKPKRRPSYYRDKKIDKRLYDQMWSLYEPCILPHRLAESLHPYDTQLNESMNQVIAKYAPKNKSFGTSMALTHRVSVAIGIHNYGHYKFWTEVFNDLQIDMPSNLQSHLLAKDMKKQKKREYQSQPDVKKKRNRDTFEKIQEGMKKMKADKKRGATYETGMGMKYSIPPEVEAIDTRTKEQNNVQCTLMGCYTAGHSRRSSKACTYYKCTGKDLQASIDAKLRQCYPSYYGELFLVFDDFVFLFCKE